MMLITINMIVRPEKSRELLITLQELTEEMKRAHGFLEARVSSQPSQPEALTFIEHWATQRDADAYLRSDDFAILHGALELLTVSFEMACSSDSGRIREMVAPEYLRRTQ